MKLPTGSPVKSSLPAVLSMPGIGAGPEPEARVLVLPLDLAGPVVERAQHGIEDARVVLGRPAPAHRVRFRSVR